MTRFLAGNGLVKIERVFQVTRSRTIRFRVLPRSMLATQSSNKHCRMARRHRLVKPDLDLPVTRHEHSGRSVDVMQPHEPFQDPQEAWLAVSRVDP